jgi:glutaminase
VLVCEDITRELGLHPIQTGRKPASPIHTRFRLDEMRSKRWRSPEQADTLQAEGRNAGAFELQGDLDFAATEQAIRAVIGADLRAQVLDFHRVNKIDDESAVLIGDLCNALEADGRAVVLSGVIRFHEQLVTAAGRDLLERSGLDLALEWCEDQLLGDADAAPEPEAVELRDHQLFAGLSEDQFKQVEVLMEHHEFAKGEPLFHAGDNADELYVVTRGRLSAFVELSPGEQRRVSTVGPGAMIGEIAFVTGSARTASVKVDSDLECWTLPHSSLLELRNAEPEMQAIMLANLLQIIAVDARMFQRALQTIVG